MAKKVYIELVADLGVASSRSNTRDGCILSGCRPVRLAGLSVYAAAVQRYALHGVDGVIEWRLMRQVRHGAGIGGSLAPTLAIRSEEHTSELQSPCNIVCRLLLE